MTNLYETRKKAYDISKNLLELIRSKGHGFYSAICVIVNLFSMLCKSCSFMGSGWIPQNFQPGFCELGTPSSMFDWSLRRNSRYFCPMALTYFNNIFWLHNNFEPLVLEWSPSENCFLTRGLKSKRYFLACLNIFFIATIIGLGSCLVVLVNPTSDPNVNNKLSFASLFVLSCGILFFTSEIILIVHSRSIVQGFRSFENFMLRLRLEILSDSGRNMRPLPGPFGGTCGSTFWKHVCNVLILGEISLLLMAIVIAPASVYAEMEPYHVTFPMIFPLFLDYPKAGKCMYLLVGLIGIGEACMLLAFYLPKMVYLIEVQFDMLIHLNQISFDKPERFLSWYQTVHIWDNILVPYVNCMTGSMMGCGFIIFIVSNVITLKCYDMLPFVHYLVAPFCSISAFAVVYFSLPFVVHIAECTGGMISERKKYFNEHAFIRVDRKAQNYVKRKFAVVKPMLTSCGGFYYLKSGTETTYYFDVLLRTIDLLLTLEGLGLFENSS